MHRMGAVNRVADHAALESTAIGRPAPSIPKSPTAQRMLKFAFNLTDDGLMGQQVFAGEATRLAYMTDEAVEGRDAFLEKRDPDWDAFPYTTDRRRWYGPHQQGPISDIAAGQATLTAMTFMTNRTRAAVLGSPPSCPSALSSRRKPPPRPHRRFPALQVPQPPATPSRATALASAMSAAATTVAPSTRRPVTCG